MARDIAALLRERGYRVIRSRTNIQAQNIETGEILSRRQFEARVLQTPLGGSRVGGGGGAEEPEPIGRRADLYQQAQEVYRSTANTTDEMTQLRPSWRDGMSLADVRRAPEFRFALRELRAVESAQRRAAQAGKPWIVYGRPERWETRLRTALVIIGYRRADWTNPVGESPS